MVNPDIVDWIHDKAREHQLEIDQESIPWNDGEAVAIRVGPFSSEAKAREAADILKSQFPGIPLTITDDNAPPEADEKTPKSEQGPDQYQENPPDNPEKSRKELEPDGLSDEQPPAPKEEPTLTEPQASGSPTFWVEIGPISNPMARERIQRRMQDRLSRSGREAIEVEKFHRGRRLPFLRIGPFPMERGAYRIADKMQQRFQRMQIQVVTLKAGQDPREAE